MTALQIIFGGLLMVFGVVNIAIAAFRITASDAAPKTRDSIPHIIQMNPYDGDDFREQLTFYEYKDGKTWSYTYVARESRMIKVNERVWPTEDK